MEYSRDSSFNMGIAHLTRIDALLYDVTSFSGDEDYENWHRSLNALSREVFFLFNETDMTQSAEHDNNCANAINNFKIDKTYGNKTICYNQLIAYELFIKQQLAQRKMLMAFSKDLRVSISDLG